MKHGVYEIYFMGKIKFEVYIWFNERKLGYIGIFNTKWDAIKCFNENK